MYIQSNHKNFFSSEIDEDYLTLVINNDGVILEANDKILEVSGYKINELVGKNRSILFDEKYKQTVEYKNFWSELLKGKIKTQEIKCIKKMGNHCFYKLHIYLKKMIKIILFK